MPGSAKVVESDAAARDVRVLEEQRPELLPWLRPLGIAIAALATEPWQSLAPLLPAVPEPTAPLLHGAIVPIDPDAARIHVWTVLAAALGGQTHRNLLNATALLEAAIAHDDDGIAAVASAVRIEPATLAAAAQLSAFTLLQSCARAIGPGAYADWTHGYCPVCGAQPALAEVIGLERRRRLRCGRCGAGWTTDVLLCAFCGERDHERLGALVPDGTAGQLAWVETCATCHGYLKVRATLRAAAASSVLIEDVRSVELDLAAAERGFRRPSSAGFAVRVRLSPLSIAMS